MFYRKNLYLLYYSQKYFSHVPVNWNKASKKLPLWIYFFSYLPLTWSCRSCATPSLSKVAGPSITFSHKNSATNIIIIICAATTITRRWILSYTATAVIPQWITRGASGRISSLASNCRICAPFCITIYFFNPYWI